MSEWLWADQGRVKLRGCQQIRKSNLWSAPAVSDIITYNYSLLAGNQHQWRILIYQIKVLFITGSSFKWGLLEKETRQLSVLSQRRQADRLSAYFDQSSLRPILLVAVSKRKVTVVNQPCFLVLGPRNCPLHCNLLRLCSMNTS